MSPTTTRIGRTARLSSSDRSRSRLLSLATMTSAFVDVTVWAACFTNTNSPHNDTRPRSWTAAQRHAGNRADEAPPCGSNSHLDRALPQSISTDLSQHQVDPTRMRTEFLGPTGKHDVLPRPRRRVPGHGGGLLLRRPEQRWAALSAAPHLCGRLSGIDRSFHVRSAAQSPGSVRRRDVRPPRPPRNSPPGVNHGSQAGIRAPSPVCQAPPRGERQGSLVGLAPD
jgi:hypothetical protein